MTTDLIMRVTSNVRTTAINSYKRRGTNTNCSSVVLIVVYTVIIVCTTFIIDFFGVFFTVEYCHYLKYSTT